MIKDLLVHLDASDDGAHRLLLSARLAGQHGARLTGLCVRDQSVAELAALKTAELGLAPAAEVSALKALFDRATRDQLASTRERFDSVCRAAGVSAEWRCEDGQAARIVPRHARYADLTMIGQDRSGDDRMPYAGPVTERTLFLSGRPAIIVPGQLRPETLASRIVVAWDASRAAARAVNDAIPLIARAALTTVVTVRPIVSDDAHGEEPGADIGAHLSRHGAHVTTIELRDSGNAGDMLLSYARQINADLIVAGCYGHSRVGEILLGGVTRRLLAQGSKPVMMSY
jgi:nucleotide-binding universal stress UspA family protein